MCLREFYVFQLPLDCQHLLGKDHGVYLLMRGNVELEHDLELGQLKFE